VGNIPTTRRLVGVSGSLEDLLRDSETADTEVNFKITSISSVFISVGG